jgi:cellulose synthase/poly-beta-1,6-N-acetylglucosamine synthase-like glycosyltransferase
LDRAVDLVHEFGRKFRTRLKALHECSFNFLALRRPANDHRRSLVHGDLFLDSTGIRDDEARLRTEADEVLVADRVDDLERLGEVGQVEVCNPLLGSWMEREVHRDLQASEGAEDALERLFRIHVLWTVERRKDEIAGHETAFCQQGSAVCPIWHQSLDRFNYRVPGLQYHVFANSLRSEILDVEVCGGEAEIADVVRQDTVVLLWHSPVERSQPCLNVDERYLVGIGSERARKNGIRVALDDNGRRLELREQLIERRGAISDLRATCLTADSDECVWSSHVEFGEKDGREVRVVVLSRVHEMCIVAEQLCDLREFDDLGSCSEHHGDWPVRFCLSHAVRRFILATLRGMLRVLIWLGQLLFVAPAVYSSTVALWGLKTPSIRASSQSSRRMRVVVAAHDEASVISGVAEDLAAQNYPSDLLRCCVIADRCNDPTAEIAGRFVEVVERTRGGGAKGAAISWYLEHEPLDADEVLVVLDADNRINERFVGDIAAAMEDGAEVVQTYLDVVNPEGSALSTANALTYWASNRMVQLARSNIGWSCDLGGTGMAMTGSALSDAGGFTDDLTDDLALNIRLNLAGHRARWLHDVKVLDEKPVDAKSTVTQRARWVRGKREVQRQYGGSLLKAGVSSRQPALLDLWYRLYNPGRSFIALVIAILAVLAGVFPEWGLWPWQVLAVIAAVVVLLPVVFLLVDRVPARYVVRYPYVTLIAILWLPIRIGSRVLTGWNRTDHGTDP